VHKPNQVKNTLSHSEKGTTVPKFVWEKVLRLSLITTILSLVATIGCGGSGGGIPSPSPSPTPNASPTPTPVATVEFLFVGNSSSSLNLSSINTSTGVLSAPAPATVQGNDEVIYPGVAVTPSKKFLYALFSSFTLIEGYTITGPGVTLTPLKNAPFFPVSTGPVNSLVLHPSGRFLYVIHSSSTIEEHAVNVDTGDLTFVSDRTEPVADFRVAIIDPAGKFLFATDLTGGRIFAYQINQADGSLSAVAGSPFALPGGNLPSIDVIDSTGNFLYVSQFAGGLAAFAINSVTGALTNVTGSPFSTNIGGVPVFLATAGKFVYVCNSNGTIDGFGVDPNTGILTQVPGSPFSTASSLAANITIDPLGKFAYVSNPINSLIDGFTLDPTSGTLAAVPGSPFPAIPQVENLFIVKFP
jgi:6-phosphogluconolactonase